MTAQKTKAKGGIVEAKDLRFALRIVSRNWYIVAVAVAVSAVMSFLYTYKLPDIYGASTSILLKEKTTYDYQSAVYKDIGYAGSYVEMINQQRVITSYDLIEDVLSRLDFEVSYFIVGRFKTSQVHSARPFTVQLDVFNNRLYERLLDLELLGMDRFELSYEHKGEVVRKQFPIGVTVNDPDLRIRLDLASYVTNETIDTYTSSTYQIMRHRTEDLNARFRSRLKVESSNWTSILKIDVQDEVEERAKMFLDTLASVYIEHTVQGEININENTLQYIDRQINEVTRILDMEEGTLDDYMEDRMILDLKRTEGTFFRLLTEAEEFIRTAEDKLLVLDDLERYILNIADEPLLPPALYIIDDSYLKGALGMLYDAQMKINAHLYTATPSNVAIQQEREIMARIRENLFTYIDNLRAAMRQRIAERQELVNEYDALLREIPEEKRGIRNIRRRVSVNEKMFLFLLEKRATTAIARAGIVPTTRIIESARGMGVVAPDKNKILSTFLLGGVVVSLLVVFVRIVFYDRIENMEQLKGMVPMPIYGEIIASEKAEENYVVVDSDPKAAITESFRTVRTNLEYVPLDEDRGKVVMVTSYRPNEGKTFCSVNLACILAKAGKKVLLLEMDLHKPKVATGLGLNSAVGLSNMLVGKVPWREVVMPTQFENMSVMLSGPSPPNASELVLSKHFEACLLEAREEYDYVVIDTPPVGLITDALLMMRHADITLFVINTRFANRDHVNNALEALEGSAARNTGFILNGVRMKKSKYYYNTNYGYGYRYAYGYGRGYGYGYGYGRKRRQKNDQPDRNA